MSHQPCKGEQAMPTELEKCEHQAKHLPLKERALLIKKLIEGLDDLDEHDLEQLWLQEASRRFQAYKNGSIKADSSEEAFSDIRAGLRDIR